MRIKLRRIDQKEQKFTTLGYWSWSKPGNKGTLTVQVSRMGDWRFEAAVWGHELIEVFYCWLFRISTEEADRFDAFYEAEYNAGRIATTQEPGDDRKCPYYVGHSAGVAWEHFWIFISFCRWSKYVQECDRIMGISACSDSR